MKIPKHIEKLIDKKEELAMELIEISSEIDKWLESKGADLSDIDLRDSTISGCYIYAEPWTAKECVKKYIENKL